MVKTQKKKATTAKKAAKKKATTRRASSAKSGTGKEKAASARVSPIAPTPMSAQDRRALEDFKTQHLLEGLVSTVPFTRDDPELEAYCSAEIARFAEAKKEYEKRHHALRDKMREYEAERIRRMIITSDMPLSLWITDPDETVRNIAERVAFERRR